MPKRIQSNTNLSSSSSLSLDTPHQNDTQKKTAVSPKTGNIKNAASSSKLKKRKKPHVTILKPRSSSNETSSISESQSKKKVSIHRRVSFKPANRLTEMIEIQDSKEQIISSSEIDEYPFDFEYTHEKKRSEGMSNNSRTESYSEMFTKKIFSQKSLAELYEDEIARFEARRKKSLIGNLSHYKEMCCGFFITALAVSALLSIAFLIVFSVDTVTDAIHRSFHSLHFHN